MTKFVAPVNDPMGRRDLRIDFFRGLALLIVLVDHLEQRARLEVIRSWTPISLGFSDAAEAFVFLSGCAFALANSRRLRADGWLTVQHRAIRRAALIYSFYVLATWTVLAMGYAWEWQSFSGLPDAAFTEVALDLAKWTMILGYQPYGFEILAFYIVLIPLAPILLWLYCWRRAVGWAASVLIYLLANWIPSMPLPTYPGTEGWYFHPLAWQFLFFLGMVWGHANQDLQRDPPTRRLVLIPAILLLLFGLWRVKVFPAIAAFTSLDATWVGELTQAPLIGDSKSLLGPVRILHFLSAAYVTRALLRRSSPIWGSHAARPLVICGQHALPVYTFGLVIMHATIPVLSLLGGSTVTNVLLLDLDACLLSILLAYGLHSLRATRRKQPAVRAETPLAK